MKWPYSWIMGVASARFANGECIGYKRAQEALDILYQIGAIKPPELRTLLFCDVHEGYIFVRDGEDIQQQGVRCSRSTYGFTYPNIKIIETPHICNFTEYKEVLK